MTISIIDTFRTTATIPGMPVNPDEHREEAGKARPFKLVSDWDLALASRPLSNPDTIWLNSSAAGLIFPLRRRVLKPIVETMDSALPMLTDRMQSLFQQLLPKMEHAARIYAAPVSKVVISGFVDPEEDNDQVVVTQWVNLTTESAFRYWDRLGALVDDWRRLLPDSLRPVADRIAIEIEWNVTGKADDPVVQSTRAI